MRAIIVAILLAVPSNVLSQTTFKKYHATFVTCYDGDTCDFDFHLSANVGLGVQLGAVLPNKRIRFCDIDTPEIRGGTDESKAAAKRARDALIGWLTNARMIEIEVPQKKNCDFATRPDCDDDGKYGRLLSYVWADGVNLNQKLLDEGHAKIFMTKDDKPLLCRPPASP